MARYFESDSADGVWRKAARALLREDIWKQQVSRCGETREILRASFGITDPRQRWVTSRAPGMSPAFAIAEVFWILAGRNDAAFLNYWNPGLPRFAGYTTTYHGAYGHRIRKGYGFDQLELAYRTLESNQESRQAVIQIWDPREDLPRNGGCPTAPDIPCNLCSMLKVRNGTLEWTQIMRSNDLFRGTPYNFVQFTTLQEIVAGWLGLAVGTYHQVSDSLHIYENDLETFGIDHRVVRVINKDNLSLTWEDFQPVLNEMLELLSRLSEDDLRRVDIRHMKNVELPDGYRNLLLVAAADSARRRGWYDEMDDFMESCSNTMLLTVWQKWLQRKRPTTREIDMGKME